MVDTLQAAVALRGAGQAEEARVLLLKLLDEEGANAELLYQLGWTHDVLGLEREAVPYYERSLAAGNTKQAEAGMSGIQLAF